MPCNIASRTRREIRHWQSFRPDRLPGHGPEPSIKWTGSGSFRGGQPGWGRSLSQSYPCGSFRQSPARQPGHGPSRRDDPLTLSPGFVLLPTACCTTRVIRTKHEAMKNVAGLDSGWDITDYGAEEARIGRVTVHPEKRVPVQAILQGELACSNDKNLQTALPTRIPIDLMIS